MTQTEISLKKELNGVWALYKRHNEDDCDELPDVLRVLEQKLKEAEYRLSAAVRMEEQYLDNRYVEFNRCQAEIEVNTIKGLIKDVTASSATLFAVAVTAFSTNVPDVIPIFERNMPLYEASVGDNGSPNFKLYGKDVPVFVIPASCAYSGKQTLIAPEKYHNYPIYTGGGFVGFDYLYLDPKEDPSCKYYACKDCGEVFVMHISQIMHFRKKGLKIPKRCVACRERRKRTAN